MERTEKRVTGAALRLFARKGFEGTSIRDIASEAGITTATLYHYMVAKEDLLFSIMEDSLNRLLGFAKETLEGLGEPEERLAALVRLHVVAHAIDRLPARVVDTEFRALGPENRARIEVMRDEYEALWRGALAEGISLGRFGIGDAKLASLALLQMCTGVAHWYSPEGPSSLREVETRFADMALSLARAERDGKPVRVADLDLPAPLRLYPAGTAERREEETV